MFKKGGLWVIVKAWFIWLRVEVGQRKRTKEEREKLKTCYNCNKGNALCPVCSCPVKALTLAEDIKCELGKW